MYPNNRFPSYGVFVKNFCEQLDEIGINYELSCITKTTNKVIKLLKYICFYISTFFRCIFINYDIVYIHYPSFSSKPVLLAQKLRNFKIITNVHGSDVIPVKKEQEKMVGITKESINISKKVVVPSEYFKNLIKEKYNISDEKIFVYPSGGINEKIFYKYDFEKKNKLSQEYGIKPNSVVIGFVSRINKAKGWDIFIDAIENCKELTKVDCTIFIVGSGEDDSELEERIKKLPINLKSSIKRYPLLPQEKLAEIYNLLDVFIFPTTAAESLGLVAIEAMACGVPVIASDFAAPKYYVKDSVNGYLFKMSDSIELANKIDCFLLNATYIIESMGIEAIDTAKKYRRENVIKDLGVLFNITIN